MSTAPTSLPSCGDDHLPGAGPLPMRRPGTAQRACPKKRTAPHASPGLPGRRRRPSDSESEDATRAKKNIIPTIRLQGQYRTNQGQQRTNQGPIRIRVHNARAHSIVDHITARPTRGQGHGHRSSRTPTTTATTRASLRSSLRSGTCPGVRRVSAPREGQL